MKRKLKLLLVWLMCIMASILSTISMFFAIFVNEDKAQNIAVAQDRSANAALNGSKDETISSRASRARKEGKQYGCVLCAVLDWLQKDHCKNSEGT